MKYLVYQKFASVIGIKEKKKAKQGKRGWECQDRDRLQY